MKRVGSTNIIVTDVPMPYRGDVHEKYSEKSGSYAHAVTMCLANHRAYCKADMMDMAMSWNLCSLDPKSMAALSLRHLGPGQYEVDGRPAHLHVRVQQLLGTWSKSIFLHYDIGIAIV